MIVRCVRRLADQGSVRYSAVVSHPVAIGLPGTLIAAKSKCLFDTDIGSV
jgi:hypothetical protein